MKYFSIAVSALALAFGLNAAQAAPLSGRPQVQSAASGLVKQVQWESGYCRQLRYGCAYKHRLGEEGEGNCRRYREQCGGYGYEGRRYEGRSYCQSLRNACIYKESRGEVGEGNCRRYREECRGN
jgi:hypothetical protein